MRKAVLFPALMSIVLIVSTRQARAEDLIHVEVVGLHNDIGQVGCSVYSSADGFLTDQSNVLCSAAYIKTDGGGTIESDGIVTGVVVLRSADDARKALEVLARAGIKASIA